MNRQKVLENAIGCVCVDRNNQYGEPEDNFGLIAELWEPYIRKACVSRDADVSVRGENVAHMMMLLKIARCTSGNYVADNYVDIAGYAACASELAEPKREINAKELLREDVIYE